MEKEDRVILLGLIIVVISILIIILIVNALKIGILLLSGFCLLASIVLLFNLITEIYKYISSYHFVSAKGVITHSELIVHPGDMETSDSYSVKIEFEYEVESKKYISKTPFLGGYSTPLTDVSNYPAGRHIIVYYNPKNPHSSYVQRRGFGEFFVDLLIVVVYFGLGMLSLLIYLCTLLNIHHIWCYSS